MVLESLMSPTSALKKPWVLFFVGLLYASVGLLLGWWIFEQYASLVMVFLTVMAAIPLFYYAIIKEESQDLLGLSEATLLKKHARVLLFFIVLFIGMTISYALWYAFLPVSHVSNIFSIQTQTIADINQQVAGGFVGSLNVFKKIFLNNIKVMIFCILFSFLYGAGAIFILTWNASVLGTAIGNFIRTQVSYHAFTSGLGGVGAYMYVFSLSLVRFFLHGIPEIFAYFVAGLAGGILSVAFIRHHIQTKHFERILLDVSNLLLISVGVLFIAAAIEVFVTPLFF